MLDYLKTVGASSALPIKELTLKLTMLLCLTTGQRGQTIHKFDINYIQDLDDRYRISVHEKLKQTKPSRHLEPMFYRLQMPGLSRGQGTLCGATFEGIYPSN